MHAPSVAADPRRSLLLLLLAGVLWGTGGVLGTALADETGLGPAAVAALRLGAGGLVLVAVSLALGARVPRSATHWRRVAAIGVLAASFQGTYFAAAAGAGVASATLVTIGSAPVFVVAVEAVGARTRPPLAVLRTVAVGVTGLALLVGSPAVGADAVAGSVWALLSGASFAGLTLINRRPVAGSSTASVTGWAFLVGAVVLTAVAAVGGLDALDFPVTGRSAVLVVLFAVVPTALAYSAYFAGLRGAGASTAAVIALLEPVTATVLAVAFLGERLTAPGILGAVLLVASVVDAGWVHARRTAAHRRVAAT